MRTLQPILIIAALVAAIFVAYQFFFKEQPATTSAESPEAVIDSPADKANNDAEPLPEVADTQSELPADDRTTSTEASDTVTAQNDGAAQQQPNFPELFAYDIGHTDLSDEDFEDLVRRLQKDNALLGDLINEFRAESDPERYKRLAFILGQTGSSDVLPVAEELAYSGDTESRKVGLGLLNQIAPNNPAAYNVATAILTSETEPDLLVATMNVFAKPETATPEVRSAMVAQITQLATHQASNVRSHSIQVLPRLTNDPSLASVLTNALYDEDSAVRESAAYAYGSYPYQTAEVEQRLLDMLEDENEPLGVRRGAIRSLEIMSPTEDTRARITAAKKQIRQSIRNGTAK